MMRVQIDTDNKTVRILTRINLSKLIESLMTILGDDFNNYDLDINTSYIAWTDPYIYPLGPGNTPAPYIKWPEITCGTGTYNVEIKD